MQKILQLVHYDTKALNISIIVCNAEMVKYYHFYPLQQYKELSSYLSFVAMLIQKSVLRITLGAVFLSSLNFSVKMMNAYTHICWGSAISVEISDD